MISPRPRPSLVLHTRLRIPLPTADRAMVQVLGDRYPVERGARAGQRRRLRHGDARGLRLDEAVQEQKGESLAEFGRGDAEVFCFFMYVCMYVGVFSARPDQHYATGMYVVYVCTYVV